MCESNERKFEINSKLEMEMENLKLLKEKVNRSKQLTKTIVNVLSSCERHLSCLDDTVLPIYNQTKTLQIKQRNIKQTLKILDHVMIFYETSKEVESIINDGPNLNSNGGSNLQLFLQAMGKLEAAIEYFEMHNSNCIEHEKVRKLFNSGRDALNEHFKEVLQHYSKHVPLMFLLDLVHPAEETEMKDRPNFNHLPEYVHFELKCTAEWLRKNYGDEYINAYVNLRSSLLYKSIQTLKEHQQSLSGSSVQSLSATNSPVLRKKFKCNTSNSRASKLLQYLFEKKRSKMLLKASQNLEHPTGFTVGCHKSSMLAGAESSDDTVDEQEMVNYLMCMMVLQKLIESEGTLMIGIVPLDSQPRAFETLIQDTLNMVVQDGESIATRARKCINHHEFSAIVVVLPILKHLQSVLPEYKKIVARCSESIISKFSLTYDILHDTAAKALDDFIERIRTDSYTQVPKDGTVHELTSNTLVFLEQLHDFTDTVGKILAKKFEYNSALTFALIAQLPGEYARKDDKKMIFGMYIQKVLNELNQTLYNKSKFYSDVYLRDVFQLNNNYQILKTLQESNLLNLVHLSKPSFESTYHKMMNDNKEAYSQSWNKVLNYIWPLENTQEAKKGSSKMRDKDRNIIKEKFSGFNKEMDEIMKMQHEYSIADEELRKSLKENNKNCIGPKYKAFYESYAKVSFTKNPKKYVKYTPEQVLAMIDKFFDVAA